MHILIHHKKIKIKECLTYKERFKSLKFVLEPINYGIMIPNHRIASTYYFCQRVDICVTDKDHKIIRLIENVKTEKRFFLWKKYTIYYLPLHTCQYLKVGEKLKIKK